MRFTAWPKLRDDGDCDGEPAYARGTHPSTAEIVAVFSPQGRGCCGGRASAVTHRGESVDCLLLGHPGHQASFAVQIPLGVPLARQDVDAIARRATTLPVIESATVTRNWPNTIAVTVVERRPVLAISQPDGYVLVDKAGLAYQTQSILPLDVVLADVSPGDKPLLSQVAAIAKAFPEKLRGKVSLITADSRDSIVLMLTSGRTVTWGSSADSELKAQVVTALLKKKPRSYIDVSSPHNPAMR
jgi:cell division protein FtsQ